MPDRLVERLRLARDHSVGGYSTFNGVTYRCISATIEKSGDVELIYVRAEPPAER